VPVDERRERGLVAGAQAGGECLVVVVPGRHRPRDDRGPRRRAVGG
jgi:hypothetical protein